MPSHGAFDLDDDLSHSLEQIAAIGAAGAMPPSLSSILPKRSQLVCQLEELNPVEAAATFAGLLTSHQLQGNCYRLESLVHLALALGTGQRKPSTNLIVRAFRELGKGICGRVEDPAEDMFVTTVRCRAGNFRVFEGTWEGSGFYLQRMLDVLEGMPRGAVFDDMWAAVLGLLRLSDLVCERANLQRWVLGAEMPREKLDRKLLTRILRSHQHLRFRLDELAPIGVDLTVLERFVFDMTDCRNLLNESLGTTGLERRPLVQAGQDLWLLLPTAVSAAIRSLVIGTMHATGRGESLHRALASAYAYLFAETPILGGRTGAHLAFRRAEHTAFAEVMTTIDRGRYLHLLFFTDGLKAVDETGIAGLNPEGSGLGEQFSVRVQAAYEYASNSPDFRGGLTVIVGCGIGRGAAIGFDRADLPDWRIEFASAYDVHTLSWSPDFDPLTLWRILDARDEVRRLGISLLNANGLINLVGWARSLDGHLIPHGQMPDDVLSGTGRAVLLIDQTSQRKLRHESATRFDPRVEKDVDGHWRRLRRFEASVFDDDRLAPTYVSEDAGKSGRLMCAYIARKRVWWAEVYVDESVPSSIAFQRWQVVQVWLTRAAPVLDSMIGLGSGPIQWNAVFQGTLGDEQLQPSPLTYEEVSAEIKLSVDSTQRVITTTTTPRYEQAQFHAENFAEQALVAALIDGVRQLAHHGPDAFDSSDLLRQVVRSPKARHGHKLLGADFLDHVGDDLTGPVVTISREDDAYARLGLGWKVRDRSEGSHIEGKEDCTSFLNLLVGRLEDELCEQLKRFGRQALLSALLYNHERATLDRDRWERTAAAVLALHDNRKATLDTMRQHGFELNAVFQTSRVLAEMAICECPLESDVQPGELDLSRLMAKAALLFHIGGWSDAIRWELMNPSLRITALGDVHGDFGWVDDIVLPFTQQASDVRIIDAEESYATNLVVPAIHPTSLDSLDPGFTSAWQEQFGATFDQTRTLVDHIEDQGIAEGKAVIATRRSKLVDVQIDELNLPESAANRLLDTLTLQSRARWRDTPVGFEDKDRFPWRYRRRLSMLRRPILQIENGPDPTLLVAPGIVRSAFVHNARNMLHGDFPEAHLSPRMKAWRSKVVGKRGATLAGEVASKLQELGWSTRVEIKVTEVLGRSFERDYGDIDVLAWRPETRRVLIIECKDVEFRKTAGEIAEQLADYRGETRSNGRRDDLCKHLDRMQVIRSSLPALSRFTGIENLEDAESHLLFRHPVPMKFALVRLSEKVCVSHLDEIVSISTLGAGDRRKEYSEGS